MAEVPQFVPGEVLPVQPRVVTPGDVIGDVGCGSGERVLYSQFGAVISSGGLLKDATVPIPGTGWIVELLFVLGRQLSNASEGIFRLAWVDTVPTSTADVDAGERVFSQLKRGQTGANTFFMVADAGVLRLRGPWRAEPRGRMLGATFSNTGSADASVELYLLWERCSASDDEGAAGLGACWS